jgi:hypothetical protein
MTDRTIMDGYAQSGASLEARLTLARDTAARTITIDGQARASAPMGPVVASAEGNLNATLTLCEQMSLGKSYNITVECTGTGSGGSASFATIDQMGRSREHCRYGGGAWTNPDGKSFQAVAPRPRDMFEIPRPPEVQIRVSYRALGGGTNGAMTSITPTFKLTIQ